MRTCTIVKRILRGIRFSIALKEESYAFLVWSVRVESWHNHDLPWQIPYKAGRTENWLAQSVEAFDCELKCCFWSPTCVCNTHTHTYTQNYLKNLMFFTPKCHFSKIMQHEHVLCSGMLEATKKKTQTLRGTELLSNWSFNIFILRNTTTTFRKTEHWKMRSVCTLSS